MLPSFPESVRAFGEPLKHLGVNIAAGPQERQAPDKHLNKQVTVATASVTQEHRRRGLASVGGGHRDRARRPPRRKPVSLLQVQARPGMAQSVPPMLRNRPSSAHFLSTV
jgi:hypothetical protein